jgi:signal transduction histidine kinase
MNDRRRLMTLSVSVLAIVSLGAVGITSLHLMPSFSAAATEPVAKRLVLALGNTAVFIFAGATLLLRISQPLLRRLEESERELDHFVRALSHDMNANFMLLDHSFRALRRSYGRAPLEGLTDGFSHVEACLKQSRRFLEDLVTLGRTGSITMEPGRVDVARVVQEVLFEQRELIDERRIELYVEEGLPIVWCNEGRVKQVLTNLVRNAIRHGCDKDFPRIRISPLPARDGDDHFAWLSVHDNGRGIPADAREEVFLPGRRLPGAHESGSGMGLAIVRKIVGYYGGQVFVDPNCARGTAFIVTLPRAA